MIPHLFASRTYGSISVLVTNTFGGQSIAPYGQFNLADYVGDDSRSVAANQQQLRSLLEAKQLKILSATHGNQVQVVTDESKVLPGDGLVTNCADVGLVALAADCVPLALLDEHSGVIAVGHCGWQGLVNKLPMSLILEFERQGGRADTSVAVIGPAICASCYEVPAQRVDAVERVCPAAVRDQRHLAIAAGVRAELHSFGFSIDEIAACTFESNELYSFRRNRVTGRHALAAVRHGGDN